MRILLEAAMIAWQVFSKILWELFAGGVLYDNFFWRNGEIESITDSVGWGYLLIYWCLRECVWRWNSTMKIFLNILKLKKINPKTSSWPHYMRIPTVSVYAKIYIIIN